MSTTPEDSDMRSSSFKMSEQMKMSVCFVCYISVNESCDQLLWSTFVNIGAALGLNIYS